MVEIEQKINNWKPKVQKEKNKDNLFALIIKLK